MDGKEKDAVRKLMKERRNALSAREREEAAKSIERELLCMKEFADCELFFTYLSCGAEISTKDIVLAALRVGKTVAAPKVTGSGQMEFYQVETLLSLSAGAFGILEPKPDRVLTPDMGKTLLLLPGLAFTRSGERLGYGGGYYDRYLSVHKEAFLAAPAYPFSVLESLPVQAHDVMAHALILPGGVVYTGAGAYLAL